MKKIIGCLAALSLGLAGCSLLKINVNGKQIGLGGSDSETTSSAASQAPGAPKEVAPNDNRVVQRSGQWAAGVAQDVGDRGVFARDLRFENNHYVLAGDHRFFEWSDRDHVAAAWRTFGHDTNGRFEH